MIVGVPKETFPGERRVALTPVVLQQLAKNGIEVLVEAGAGTEAGFSDAEFTARGGKIAAGREEVFDKADIITQVLCYGSNDKTGQADLPLMRKDQIVIGFLRPLGSIDRVQEIASTGATAFSVELMPRSTRAQAMDALSSMATVCGYKAVLIAAANIPRFFPMMTTAAGTITPARVLVIGAGVAGLQAIATAKRLGAVVSGYDIRPASKEQVNSLGAKFVELALETKDTQDARGYATQQDESFYRRQRELLGEVVAQSDAVISTAAIPGKKPPLLITADAVRKMTPGSVIVDLAAEQGGNCELTKSAQDTLVNGVKIVGRINLASTVPYHASLMYSRNLTAFLNLLVKKGELNLDLKDDIIRDTLLTRGGEVVNDRVKKFFGIKAEPVTVEAK
ncbi:MAG TPA: NAD(P) transhydrogenase subunit alpha [Tepidisphaeraceae bacterium]|nr:NAD(P) transhydrogenase subunit alpha [Tepidisphaeraceae bacterium]